MEKQMVDVVGIAFFKNNSLLISKSHNCAHNNKYTLVGGKIEKDESILDAAIRECKEEIGSNFNITKEDFIPILHFKERAASDPNLFINIYILLSTKEIDVPLITSEEILDYKWYTLKDGPDILGDSISKHLLKYAISRKLL
ncbi:MAG: NUDIX hydrolase [Clostridia bacterium]